MCIFIVVLKGWDIEWVYNEIYSRLFISSKNMAKYFGYFLELDISFRFASVDVLIMVDMPGAQASTGTFAFCKENKLVIVRCASPLTQLG